MALKTTTLRHLAAAKDNRFKLKPSDFLRSLAVKGPKGASARKAINRMKRSRKALADKLRNYRKESPANARIWHRAGY